MRHTHGRLGVQRREREAAGASVAFRLDRNVARDAVGAAQRDLGFCPRQGEPDPHRPFLLEGLLVVSPEVSCSLC